MGLKQLNQLFDVYSKSLTVVQPNIGEAFVCPICMRRFGRESVENRSLTVEHVPPRSIGSSITTLTCRECNNKVGNRLQNQMKNYVTEKEFLAGIVPKEGIPARAEVEGFSWSFVIREVPGKGRVTGVSFLSHLPRRMEPHDFSQFVGKKAQFSLRLRRSPDIVDAAYLHSAYLVLFHYLGYPYILQKALAPIRDKILSFSTKGGISHVVRAPGVNFNPRERGVEIGMLWQSFDTICLGVIIAGEVVLMPFLNESYIEILEMLSDAYRKLKEGKQQNIKPTNKKLQIAPLEIDPDCKFSTSFQFEDGGLVDNLRALKLVPVDTT